MKRLALFATLTLTGIATAPATAGFATGVSSAPIVTIDNEPPCNQVRTKCPHK